MSKLFNTRLLIPMAAALLAVPLAVMSSSFAQDNSQDSMKAPVSSMSKDSMSPGSGMGMRHDTMMHHPMKKDSMQHGSMSKDAMSHDTMSREAMSKDAMSPGQPQN